MSNKLLLIGIDKYLYQQHQDLQTCVKDVTDFRNTLYEKFEFYESDTYELFDDKATNKNIQDAFSGYCKTAKSEDNLIIYYSGHGSYNSAEGRGFWIPFDGTKDYTTWLPNETIITFLQRIPCKHIFIICDSCFSNSLLITDIAKSNDEYNNRSSRWALTSAYDESYCPNDPNSNSLFAESIIDFLEETNSDLRISKLIEHVKDYFSTNENQTPQGCPIKMAAHKGGELVLKFKNEIDNRIFRGYKDFYKVLSLYKRNAKFEKEDAYEDKTNKIGFQLYKELDPIVKKLTYYLYLYSGINQTKTLKYLKDNYSSVLKSQFLIFLPKEIDQINLSKRKNNINNKFKPTNIFYIDEFIREVCTPKSDTEEESNNFLQISNFILPSCNSQTGNDVNSITEKWYYSYSEPILVIKGTGGIGKTTFAQYIIDNYFSKSPFTSVLFIDSVKIKDNLVKRNNYVDQLGIYNFYEALFNHEDSTEFKLTEETFKLNLDAGNILLVIDGLDEVISKLPNFNIDSFLTSIVDTSNELGGGKVIITCRSHFWNQVSDTANSFEVLELMPFNKDQTIEFFSKSYAQPRKIDQALKLADDFKFSDFDNQDLYHPYVLDIIRSIIDLDTDAIEQDLTEFNSSILNCKVKNDYIIFRVCDRERKRIGQISIDEQITFFIYLANNRRGNIQTLNFKKEIETAIDRPIDHVNVEAFKSHPFLYKKGNTISFRYDFFSDIFKAIHIANILNSDNPTLDDFFYSIISENCWYGSSLNSEIVKRIKKWGDYEHLLVSDLIEQISKDTEISKQRKRDTISNIFNISLSINHKFFQDDILSNTNLLKAVFEKQPNTIVNLCIINLNTDKALKFDFSNMSIHEAYIDGYNSFYDCTFNGSTKFYKSDIININSNKNKKSIPDSIFIDCTYDKHIAEAIKDFNDAQRSNIDRIKSFLNLFFHLFYSNGRLGRQWEEKVIKPRFNGVDKYNIGYKKTMRILKKHKVLISAEEKEGIKLYIADEYKEDVVRFVKDGTITTTISTLIKVFAEP